MVAMGVVHTPPVVTSAVATVGGLGRGSGRQFLPCFVLVGAPVAAGTDFIVAGVAALPAGGGALATLLRGKKCAHAAWWGIEADACQRWENIGPHASVQTTYSSREACYPFD